MKFRNQTSLKRLTQKKRDSLAKKPSLVAILLLLIAFLQVPISLKSSIGIFCLLSENTQKILNDACRAIGICRKAITTKRIAIKDGLVVNESLFLWVNLFREV